MKLDRRYLAAPVLSLCLLAGCGGWSGDRGEQASGVIYSLEYTLPNGGVSGFTRVNSSKAVPGGAGFWNVDATGTLNRDFLIVTRPQQKGLGPEAIPVARLVYVQFGDGGIKQVDESHPAP